MWQGGALSHRFRHVAQPKVECRTVVFLPNRVHGWATRAAASLLRLVLVAVVVAGVVADRVAVVVAGVVAGRVAGVVAGVVAGRVAGGDA